MLPIFAKYKAATTILLSLSSNKATLLAPEHTWPRLYRAFFDAIALLIISLALIVVVLFSITAFRRVEHVGNGALLSATMRLNTADRRTASIDICR
jgi:hypothetical protein